MVKISNLVLLSWIAETPVTQTVRIHQKLNGLSEETKTQFGLAIKPPAIAEILRQLHTAGYIEIIPQGNFNDLAITPQGKSYLATMQKFFVPSFLAQASSVASGFPLSFDEAKIRAELTTLLLQHIEDLRSDPTIDLPKEVKTMVGEIWGIVSESLALPGKKQKR